MPNNKTRKLHRRSPRRSVSKSPGRSLRSLRRSYRRHVKLSPCATRKQYSCVRTRGCKMASGKKRSFCRRRLNMRTRRH